ncbi:hypothetical protein [Salinibacterium sp. PAMC 21357]|uniref:hypothetical protein n=1 Tax=Salinibacterium sp. PAMC 21357 TaxID=1112215 RepID=UPI0002884271|nr:hypothetical protein [Salinibacterium sp. PAMC 21357]
MEGIRQYSAASSTLAIVDLISEEFSAHLKERLSAFCFGAVQAAEDASYYSFERTLREFLERYDSKAHSTKIGMAGELIIHALMPHIHPGLTSAAVFFNKEERSIKKGFDSTFYAAASSAIWYAEVKSGEVRSGQSADEKVASLIGLAASGVEQMLGSGALRSRWDSAIVDAALTLESSEAATVKKLLRSDADSIAQQEEFTKNVILAAAVMHEISHCQVSDSHLSSIVADLDSSGRFSATQLLVVQQEAIESLISILRGMADDG